MITSKCFPTSLGIRINYRFVRLEDEKAYLLLNIFLNTLIARLRCTCVNKSFNPHAVLIVSVGNLVFIKNYFLERQLLVSGQNLEVKLLDS